MKMKHNKKRNTAFIYEVIIRELTKAIVKEDKNKKILIVKLIREHFKGNTYLSKDLDLYKAILETKEVDKYTAEKMIFQARTSKGSINHKALFAEQSNLINKINKFISPDVFSNFVPNYKDLATVFQIFNPKVKTRQRVLLESEIIQKMISNEEKERELLKPIDNFTYKTFVKKFNEKYSSSLLPEQKNLLGHYVSSFVDNGINLKIFLNEEIPRLRESVSSSLESKEIKSDKDMSEKTRRVLDILANTSKRHVDNKFVHEILKIQNLAKELK
jgi:hypothetical protein